MRSRLGIIALLMVALLTPALAPSTAGSDATWPPIRVHLGSQVEGWNITFLVTLENLTDRPLEGLTIKAVPGTSTRQTTRLVDSWAGSQGQNRGVFDGVAVGWIHDEVAPRSQEGPFAFTISFQRSALATFAAYAWVSWMGPVAGAFTSQGLAVAPPPPEPPARPIAVKRFWISTGWNTPPQTQFTEVQDISYVEEVEDFQPGDLIEFRVYDQATGRLVSASGQRLIPSLDTLPPGLSSTGGGGIKRLPSGSYRAEIYTNGRRQGEAIAFQVVPYTGLPSVCRGIGAVDATVVLERAEEAAKAALAAGAVASTVMTSTGDFVKIQFAVAPEVGPEANPRDKAMEETERVLAAIKEGLASLGIPRENMHSLQTAPDCRLVGPSPWATPPAAAAPGA